MPLRCYVLEIEGLTTGLPDLLRISPMNLLTPVMDGLLIWLENPVGAIRILGQVMPRHPISPHHIFLLRFAVLLHLPPLVCGLTNHPVNMSIQVMNPSVLRHWTRHLLLEVTRH